MPVTGNGTNCAGIGVDHADRAGTLVIDEDLTGIVCRDAFDQREPCCRQSSINIARDRDAAGVDGCVNAAGRGWVIEEEPVNGCVSRQVEEVAR